jgi:hypothetical protein
MATQAVVSVVRDGKVQVKAVCGCDGYYAEKLAQHIVDGRTLNPRHVYKAAVDLHFGCERCLVVMSKDKEFFFGTMDLEPSYRATFDQPEFNPRWHYGTADYVLVVNADDWTIYDANAAGAQR